jgi:hypothetical protein
MPSVSRWFAVLALVLLAAGLSTGGILVRQHLVAAQSDSSRVLPQSAAMEQLTGVRFSRVAVVGDGGLITLSYVVLDEAKATVFQSDTGHPPKLTSESRALSTTRVSLMKQGHTLRTGQTYYLVYENTRAALRAGERVTIADGAVVLVHVPVL